LSFVQYIGVVTGQQWALADVPAPASLEHGHISLSQQLYRASFGFLFSCPAVQFIIGGNDSAGTFAGIFFCLN